MRLRRGFLAKLVLHTSALDGQLLLWGETPSDAGKPRRRKTSQAAPSPFDPGGDRLLQALAETLPDHASDRAQAETLIAWLPSAAGYPLASSRLIAEPPSASTKL